jgi:hypothetical protein
MVKSILALNGVVPLVVGIAIFILLWVFIFEAFKKAPFFEGNTLKVILTTCVSLLSVIAMFRPLGTGEKSYNVSERVGSGGSILDAIYFVYAVFGYLFVFMAILLLVNKLLGKSKPNKSLINADRKMKATFQLDANKSSGIAKKNHEKIQGRKTVCNNNQSPKPVDRDFEDRVHQSDIRKETKSNRIKR